MGGSGKWLLKSLINLKKLPTSTDPSEDRGRSNKKKWKLWRSSLEGTRLEAPKRVHVEGSGRSDSDSSSFGDDSFVAAIASLAKAQPGDFRVVRQEWGAIRIQTAFRGLLARRAFRALRAVVRIQALFRGRQVRKQAAVTLRCMQALARVQARVRTLSVRMSSEGQHVQKPFEEFHNQADSVKQAERGWCDSPGTVDEVKAKLQMRHEGVIKRERALAYSLSQKPARACPNPASAISKLQLSLKNQRPDCNSPCHILLDCWMTTKPWENRLMEDLPVDLSETPFSLKSEDNITAFYSNSCKNDMVKVRKNNFTTKVLAKPSAAARDNFLSLSAPSSKCFHDESSASSSCTSASPIPLSSNKVVDNYTRKPSYMNLTESIKAKQYALRHSSQKVRRNLVEDQFQTKSMELSSGNTKSSASSNSSSYLINDLYLPVPLDRRNEKRVQRQLRRPTLTTS